MIEIDCEAGCRGTGSTTTAGSATGVRAGAARESNGTASCEAAGGGCEAYSSTETDTSADTAELASWRTGPQTDGDASASSSAGASVGCDAAECSGKASSVTSGTVTGTAGHGGWRGPGAGDARLVEV